MMMTLTNIIAQISPGKLTDAHAHLEGMGNCTQCHDLGNKVPDQKCLACHTEIDQLINQNRGFHISLEVSSKTCVDCHNEHHGRRFEMVRFDEENFDHKQAGYELEGEHAVIDCRACHQPDNIADIDIRKREDTYLGLDEACLSCHDDFHQETLSNDCIQCHGYDSFRPAVGFDHNEAKFKLDGAHTSVDCKECHPSNMRNGVEFQEFTGLQFSDCKACHDDAHNGNLTGQCTQCHTTDSFSSFIGKNRFNHNSTNFTLRGSHQTVNCFDCHTQTSNPLTIFQENISIDEDNCIACHNDSHEGKFGNDCIRCHSEESWYSLKAMDDFDHSVTDFPLVGQHIGVDCKSCHTDRLTEAIDFAQCKNCHEDYHRGEFVDNGVSPDCKECHILDEKFTYTTFGFDEHAASDFPLDGAHMATPCFACHVSEDDWSFKNVGESCVDCHDDIHADYMDQKYYPIQDCTTCHNTDIWSDVKFEHSLTEWPLTGAHNNVDCRLCHFEDSAEDSNPLQVFTGLSHDCTHCHDNIHGDQFEVNGMTDCNSCHTTMDWFPNNFDHNLTTFPLEGRHAEIDCRACHDSEANEEGEIKVIYKIGKTQCIDCHS